jgi:hypothetical protein
MNAQHTLVVCKHGEFFTPSKSLESFCETFEYCEDATKEDFLVMLKEMNVRCREADIPTLLKLWPLRVVYI